MTQAHGSSPTPRTLSSSGDAEQTPPSSSSCAQCFHCLCTVCGRRLSDVPAVTCSACGSQTHITCARDVYSHEWLLAEVVGATGAAGGANGGGSGGGGTNVASSTGTVLRPTATTAASITALRTAASPCLGALGGAPAATDTAVEAPPSPPSPVGSSSALYSLSVSRDASFANLVPSTQALASAAARIDKHYNYYCHPDCAMGMEVQRNPQFNAALSSRIEAAFEEDWRQTLQLVERRIGGGETTVAAAAAANMKREGKTTKALVTASRDSPSAAASGGVFAQLHGYARGDAAVTHELCRLYSQLRAEAWADYFAQELHHSGHPLFYPPPFVDVQREAALTHVLEAATPQGQAARLYSLDAATHPVGSAVAIPVGVLTRWQQPAVAPLIKVNDSNNFVAEAALVVANGAVTPETVTVYRTCAKEGRVSAA